MAQLTINPYESGQSRTAKVNAMLADLYGRALTITEKVSFVSTNFGAIAHLRGHFTILHGGTLPAYASGVTPGCAAATQAKQLNTAFAAAYVSP